LNLRAGVLVIALSVLASRVSALDATLRVEPGATCVSEGSLRAQIVSWLGGTRVGAGMAIEVRGSASDPREIGFVLREGARTLASREFAPGPSACAQLETSLALAIALALKASLLRELEPARPSWRVGVATQAVALLGFAPRGAFGGQATVDVALAHWLWTRAGLTYAAAGDNALPRGQGRFDLQVFALRGELCGAPLRQPRWSLFACAGARVGGLWARGQRVPSSASSRDPWVALGASLGAALHLSPRWSVEAGAALLASLVRARFELRTRDGERADASTIASLACELSLGPRLRF
jgi:hypothetical protein